MSASAISTVDYRCWSESPADMAMSHSQHLSPTPNKGLVEMIIRGALYREMARFDLLLPELRSHIDRLEFVSSLWMKDESSPVSERTHHGVMMFQGETPLLYMPGARLGYEGGSTLLSEHILTQLGLGSAAFKQINAMAARDRAYAITVQIAP